MELHRVRTISTYTLEGLSADELQVIENALFCYATGHKPVTNMHPALGGEGLNADIAKALCEGIEKKRQEFS